MEIDHVFFFVERGGPEFARLSALGIVETYRRAHPGQGTANACFCFENMFLELLWIEAPLDALAPAIARTQLEPRSNWRKIGSCPFGIAWRAQGRLDIPTWAYTPPYLPTGVAIEVAEDSDDPRQPMLFTFPGSTAPAEWDSERKGKLQSAAGFSTIANLTMTLPHGVAASSALNHLSNSCSPGLDIRHGPRYGLNIRFVGATRTAEVHFGD
jgi:hypothetical protein